jgi:outer membrane protein assembly factor BamA
MRSDNGSNAVGAGFSLYLRNGWAFDAAFAEADLRYDLFFSKLKLPIRQDGRLANVGLTFDVAGAWSLGTAVRYLQTSISLERPGTPAPSELLPDLDLDLLSLGLRVKRDRRNDSDYPTDGSLLSIAANHGISLDGLERSYDYGIVDFDKYYSLSDTTVLAGRLTTCAASSDAPFFDKCSIGLSDAMRGFSPTEFINTRLLSAQVELRQRLGRRFGIVAFAGIGWTGDSYSDLSDNGSHSAIGTGLRYRVSKSFPVDFSADVSFNDAEETYLYLYVGQRF